MAGRKPTDADLKSYRRSLVAMRRELAGDMIHLEADAFVNDGERASTDNPADIGSDSFAQEFSLELLQRDGRTLNLVEVALERLGQGSFGRCRACEGWVTKPWLTAIPFAENCIDCQRQAECRT